MAKRKIIKDDLLFHSVHGLCRVDRITQSAPDRELSYILFPVSRNKAKVRFVIPEGSLEDSGFGLLISNKEAYAILEYFKRGGGKASGRSQAWQQAALIWFESCRKESVRDSRRRQRVDRAVRGLAGELAVVLKMTSKEIIETIKKSLGQISHINPLVLTSFANIAEE